MPMFLSKLARSFQTYANIYKKHVSQTESIENASRRGISTTFSGNHWIMYDYCWDISVTSNNLLDLWQVPATSTAAIPPTPLLYICSCLPAQLPTKGCRWCCRRWRRWRPLAGFPTSAGGFQVGKMRFVVEHVTCLTYVRVPSPFAPRSTKTVSEHGNLPSFETTPHKTA